MRAVAAITVATSVVGSFSRSGDLRRDVRRDGDCALMYTYLLTVGWWRGTVVERRSVAGELSLSCARPAADG